MHDELHKDGRGSPAYRALLEVLREAVLTMDGARNIRAVNPAAAELLGLDPQQALGLTCQDVLGCTDCGPACAVREALDRASARTGFRTEVRLRDGETRSVVIDAVPADDGHLTVILRDVTPEGWQSVPVHALAAFEDQVGRIRSGSSGHQMEHDPVWLRGLTEIPSQSVLVFVLRSGGRTVGYAPFVVYPSTIALELGRLRLLKRTVSRYVLAGEPVLDETVAPGAAGFYVDLFRALRTKMEPTNMVFLAAVAADSVLHGLITRKSPLRKDYHVVPHGPAYQRRRILMKGGYDDYLKSLRQSTRRGLKRARKKFLAVAGEEYSVRRFESPADVEPFLQHATEVSKKTYQWHLLGQGMRDLDIRSIKYAVAAGHGWFRSYVLYAKGTPIAFASGYLHRKTYFGHELGCDMDWRTSNAGIFLALEIVRDLFEDADPPEVFDFLYGDSQLKARLANSAREEQHFCLFPRGLRGALTAYPLRTVNWLSASARTALDRLRIKDRLWRLRRRRSVKG